jgi:hypothetical protein
MLRMLRKLFRMLFRMLRKLLRMLRKLFCHFLCTGDVDQEQKAGSRAVYCEIAPKHADALCGEAAEVNKLKRVVRTDQ